MAATTELQILESFRILSANFEQLPNFKNQMEEFGYNTEKMEEGKQIFIKTSDIYTKNQEANALEKQHYTIFSEGFSQLKTDYGKHRKVAKVALMNNAELWKAFEIDKPIPNTYLKIM